MLTIRHSLEEELLDSAAEFDRWSWRLLGVYR